MTNGIQTPLPFAIFIPLGPYLFPKVKTVLKRTRFRPV